MICDTSSGHFHHHPQTDDGAQPTLPPGMPLGWVPYHQGYVKNKNCIQLRNIFGEHSPFTVVLECQHTNIVSMLLLSVTFKSGNFLNNSVIFLDHDLVPSTRRSQIH